jgi:hypothetical protein
VNRNASCSPQALPVRWLHPLNVGLLKARAHSVDLVDDRDHGRTPYATHKGG